MTGAQCVGGVAAVVALAACPLVLIVLAIIALVARPNSHTPRIDAFLRRIFWIVAAVLLLWNTLPCWDGVFHDAPAPMVTANFGSPPARAPLYTNQSQAEFVGIVMALGVLYCAYMATLGIKPDRRQN
jgi:hypothetical protein